MACRCNNSTIFWKRMGNIYVYIRRFIIKAVLYNCIFLFLEVMGRFIKYGSDANGMVDAPLWMLIVYIHIAWLDDLIIPYFKKKRVNIFLQAFLIMLLILVFEFLFGVFFRFGLDVIVWDYSRASLLGYPVHLFGVVSLYGIIPWYGVSLFLLWIYPRIKAIADFRLDQKGNEAVS